MHCGFEAGNVDKGLTTVNTHMLYLPMWDSEPHDLHRRLALVACASVPLEIEALGVGKVVVGVETGVSVCGTMLDGGEGGVK